MAMTVANEKYAEWCDETGLCLINEANVLNDYGLSDKAKICLEAAHKFYAEARLIRSGDIVLDHDTTLAFLYRKTKH